MELHAQVCEVVGAFVAPDAVVIVTGDGILIRDPPQRLRVAPLRSAPAGEILPREVAADPSTERGLFGSHRPRLERIADPYTLGF
jgi:hypothetical protein